jgi:hypothetical protein
VIRVRAGIAGAGAAIGVCGGVLRAAVADGELAGRPALDGGSPDLVCPGLVCPARTATADGPDIATAVWTREA